MGFFSTVNYVSAWKDNSWLSKFEDAANVCRAPSRWIASELTPQYSKVYEVSIIHGLLSQQSEPTKAVTGALRVARAVLGVLFSIPGQIVAIPLMAVAFCSQEIRFKHKYAAKQLSDLDEMYLKNWITERKKLADEKKGCEAVTCFLCSMCTIVSLLCCIAFKK